MDIVAVGISVLLLVVTYLEIRDSMMALVESHLL